jgi:hypothetical protein
MTQPLHAPRMQDMRTIDDRNSANAIWNADTESSNDVRDIRGEVARLSEAIGRCGIIGCHRRRAVRAQGGVEARHIIALRHLFYLSRLFQVSAGVIWSLGCLGFAS